MRRAEGGGVVETGLGHAGVACVRDELRSLRTQEEGLRSGTGLVQTGLGRGAVGMRHPRACLLGTQPLREMQAKLN